MKNEFISKEERDYSFKVGKSLASALAGFVAGSVFTSVIWFFALYITKLYEG